MRCESGAHIGGAEGRRRVERHETGRSGIGRQSTPGSFGGRKHDSDGISRDPRARPSGPPRSTCQNHSEKRTILLIQMTIAERTKSGPLTVVVRVDDAIDESEER